MVQTTQDAGGAGSRHPKRHVLREKIITSVPAPKAARSPDLKAAFEKHRRETDEQIRAFRSRFLNSSKMKCPAIDGIVEEAKEVMKEYKGSPVLDSGLLSGAQAIEHYEIRATGPFAPGRNNWAFVRRCRCSKRLEGREKDR